MAREARDRTAGTNVEPSMIQRVAAGVRYMVSGVAPDNWFGPSQPLPPLAQDQAEGRQFDYPVGYNLRTTPRSNEQISFHQLRGLADGYDLMRTIIEKRKDQIEAFGWKIVPEDDTIDADTMSGAIDDVKQFLKRPDQRHTWKQWLRQVTEEVLVTDALCVYPRPNLGGSLYGLELVDGATIKRVIDVTGRTPLPPDPAYQQILKGVASVDYSSDDLVYMPRNPRVHKLYGFSPVEQVITTVNIALRRQMSQLAFYTEGNVPEAIAQTPQGWTSKQIMDFQKWFDAKLAGNLAARRKISFIPSLENIVFTKSQLIKDEMDEWLARLVCFCFSISPSALIKQVNRASGEQMADTAKEEGLVPLLGFIEEFMTLLVQKYLGQPKLCFKFELEDRVNKLEQAQCDKIYLDAEVILPDEVRMKLDMDALTPEQREAAWPTPPPPGFNADGTPILPTEGQPGQPGGESNGSAGGSKPANPASKPAVSASKPAATETPAEKMLLEAIRMLDPERLAKIFSDIGKAAAPNVVEIKPEVFVDVGDTVVHVPSARRERT